MARKKHAGHESPATQAIANALPPWHVIRNDRTTTGRKVLNVPAMFVEDLEDQAGRARRNLYPATADTLVRWEAYRAEVPEGLLLKTAPDANFLGNAAFRPGMAHRKIPYDWTILSGELDSRAAFGGGSVKLSLAPGETGELFQRVDRRFEAGRPVTASVYAKGDAVSVEIEASVAAWGPDLATGEVDFLPGAAWTRGSATVTPPSRANSLEFRARVVNTDTGEIEVLLSAPQISMGLADWLPSRTDVGSQPFLLSAVAGDERILLSPVTRLADLFEDAIPTRLSVTEGATGEILEPRTGPIYPEFDGSRWETRWGIEGDAIVLGNAQVAGEACETYALAERYAWNASGDTEYEAMSGTFPGFSRTLEKVLSFRGRLYVLCRETQDGTTVRTLKIVDAHGLDGELDVIADLLVGVDAGSVTRFGFIEGHMERLAFQVDDTTWYTIELAFDGYLYDERTRQVLLRHPYTGMTLTFTEF